VDEQPGRRWPISAVTTALDVLALLAVAGGVGLGLWPVLHGYAVAVAGVVLGAGSAVAAFVGARPEPAP